MCSIYNIHTNYICQEVLKGLGLFARCSSHCGNDRNSTSSPPGRRCGSSQQLAADRSSRGGRTVHFSLKQKKRFASFASFTQKQLLCSQDSWQNWLRPNQNLECKISIIIIIIIKKTAVHLQIVTEKIAEVGTQKQPLFFFFCFITSTSWSFIDIYFKHLKTDTNITLVYNTIFFFSSKLDHNSWYKKCHTDQVFLWFIYNHVKAESKLQLHQRYTNICRKIP